MGESAGGSHLFLDGGQDSGGGLCLRAVPVGGVEDWAEHGGVVTVTGLLVRHWHHSWKTHINTDSRLLNTHLL